MNKLVLQVGGVGTGTAGLGTSRPVTAGPGTSRPVTARPGTSRSVTAGLKSAARPQTPEHRDFAVIGRAAQQRPVTAPSKTRNYDTMTQGQSPKLPTLHESIMLKQKQPIYYDFYSKLDMLKASSSTTKATPAPKIGSIIYEPEASYISISNLYKTRSERKQATDASTKTRRHSGAPSPKDTNSDLISKLLHALSVPDYVVYDWATQLCNGDKLRNSNYAVSSFLNSATYEPGNAEMERIYKSYILTQCIIHYTTQTLGITDFTNDNVTIFAMEYTLAKLVNADADADVDVSTVFSEASFEFAYDNFSQLYSDETAWWYRSQSQTDLQIGRGSNHPATFIVQAPTERICGFISIFTIISKCGELQEFFKTSLKANISKKKELIAGKNGEQLQLYIEQEIRTFKFIMSNLAILIEKNNVKAKQKYAPNIAYIGKEIDKLEKYIKPTLDTDGIIQYCNKSVDASQAFFMYVMDLFHMSNNVDTMINQDFSQIASARFNTHRLLDHLQRLYPNLLQWFPFGATVITLYMYTIHMFILAGVDAADISVVYSKKNQCKIFVQQHVSQKQHLYVHFLIDDSDAYDPMDIMTQKELELQQCDDVFNVATGTGDNDNTLNLGGFVFVSTPAKKGGSCHAICGYQNSGQQYLYNGYNDLDNPTLPCAALQTPTWSELFSGRDYFLGTTGKCGMHTDAGIRPADISKYLRFAYPFSGFFGIGIHRVVGQEQEQGQGQEQANASNINLLQNAYIANFEKHTCQEINKILENESSITTKLDALYDLCESSGMFLDLYLEPAVRIESSPGNLKFCIKVIIEYLYCCACEYVLTSPKSKVDIDVGKVKSLAKRALENTYVDLFDSTDSMCNILEIIIYVAARYFKDLQNEIATTLDVPDIASVNEAYLSKKLTHTIDVVFNFVKPIYLYANVANEFASFLGEIVDEVEDLDDGGETMNDVSNIDVRIHEWVVSKITNNTYAIFASRIQDGYDFLKITTKLKDLINSAVEETAKKLEPKKSFKPH
jgi:hypothetical protein